MSKTSYYVDGFNLYHAIRSLDCPELKWLKLRALVVSYLQKHDKFVEVTYFTAHWCGTPKDAVVTEPKSMRYLLTA